MHNLYPLFMGWYGRKSIKIAPGLHLNFSKTGVGYSIGPRGAKYTVSPAGRVTQSVSIPGTGIRYQTSKSPNNSKRVVVADQYIPQHVSSHRGIWLTWFGLAGLDFFIFIYVSNTQTSQVALNILGPLFWVFLISGIASKTILKNK